LQEEDDIRVVAEARTAAQALSAVEQHQPDVLLIDIQAPRGDCVKLMASVLAQPDRTAPRMIILASLDFEDDLFLALRAGASGYLLKDVTQPELASAVRAVAAGGAVICPMMLRRLLDVFEIRRPPDGLRESAVLNGLSGREIEVLTSIATGKSNKEIAHELHLTTATVKSHVSNLLTKLKLRDRVQVALLAYQHGLVRSDP
jgi:DNA-binding NarL/FixJ family response regulator